MKRIHILLIFRFFTILTLKASWVYYADKTHYIKNEHTSQFPWSEKCPNEVMINRIWCCDGKVSVAAMKKIEFQEALHVDSNPGAFGDSTLMMTLTGKQFFDVYMRKK